MSNTHSTISKNDKPIMKLMDIRKPYIDTVNYYEAYLNGERCIVLDVHYQHSNAAQYHAGRDYLTEFLGGAGTYMGTTSLQTHRQYWYRCEAPTQDLDWRAEFLKGVYHEEVNVRLPMPIRDPEGYRKLCERRK
jgi:predicted RNA-binding protein with PIN domain